MEDNEFWFRVWGLVAACACVLVLTFGGCTAHRNTLVTDMVKAGADPLDAACAVGSISEGGGQVVCGVRAGIKEKP